MAAAGAGGGVARQDSAYLLIGHGRLAEGKLNMKTVPVGFTLASRASCGKETVFGKIESLFNNDKHNEIYEPNSESGVRFFAKRLGPLTINKSSSEFADNSFVPLAIGKIPGNIFIFPSGIIESPFSKDKWTSGVYPFDTPMVDVDILKYFDHSIYPTRNKMEEAIKKAILIDKNKELFDELLPSIEDKRQATWDEIITMLSLDDIDISTISRDYTIGKFYDDHMHTLKMLLSVRISDIFETLPKPGVIYSLAYRSGSENNIDIGRQRISEAIGSRKLFAKALNRQRVIREEIDKLEYRILTTSRSFGNIRLRYEQQLKNLKDELATYKGGGKTCKRRYRRRKTRRI